MKKSEKSMYTPYMIMMLEKKQILKKDWKHTQQKDNKARIRKSRIVGIFLFSTFQSA